MSEIKEITNTLKAVRGHVLVAQRVVEAGSDYVGDDCKPYDETAKSELKAAREALNQASRILNKLS